MSENMTIRVADVSDEAMFVSLTGRMPNAEVAANIRAEQEAEAEREAKIEAERVLMRWCSDEVQSNPQKKLADVPDEVLKRSICGE